MADQYAPYPCPTYWMAEPPVIALEHTCPEGQKAVRWLCAVCNEWHDTCPPEKSLAEELKELLDEQLAEDSERSDEG